jgi:hypothetical protein
MRRLALVAVVAVVVSLGAGAPARAQGQPVAVEAGHRRFAEQYVAAARARDAERYRRLVHPKSLACITDENRDFYDDWIARAFRWKWSGPYRIVTVKALPKGTPPSAPAGMAVYPVPPTHQIQIDLEMSASRSASLVAEIAASGGAWLQVLPCPTAEGLAAFRSAKQANAAHEARAHTLTAGLAAPLRAEVMAMLKDGRRIDAMRRFATASGEDLAMARRVIDLLEGEGK